jgi:NADPH oxidase 5
MSEISIDKLKSIFTQIAGEDKIIDRDEFKEVLNIKDKKMSNRLFDLFDDDDSGTLEVDEFISTVTFLQNADEKQKLKFAFDLYDIDGSGTIEYYELGELIKSGLTENNLTFSDDQVEDLIQLLFSEVDTDGNGEISFDEFEEVARKYPDLLSGMTVSPIFWLKPKEKNIPSKKKVNENLIIQLYKKFKNGIDQKTFIFYTIYLMINMLLFNNSYLYFHNAGVNIFIQLGMGFGAILNFNGAVILLPMLRNFITRLRKTVLYNYIPLDDAVTFHRFVGHLMFFSALFHIGLFILNFSTLENPLSFYLINTLPGITGISLILIFILMWVTALPFIRKGGYFKLFYISHYGYIFWLLILLLHGPSYWKWLIIPGLLFIYERVKRSYSLIQETTVYDVALLPSNVLGFYMNKPKTFNYNAGDYFFIKCPEISNFEWHPFTISSAPEDNEIMSCHIRSVGSWTGNLLNYYKKLRNKDEVDRKIDITVFIDGPYGTASDKVFNSKVAILVSTGIGVTPYSSILKSLLYRIYTNKDKNTPEKIYFYWQNRGQNSFEWFVDLLAEIEEIDVDKRFNLNIYLTGTESQKDMKSNMLYIAMDMKHKKTKIDLITGLKIKTNFGRPNWNQLFEEIAKEQEGKEVKIFFCGHPAAGKQLKNAGDKFHFTYHQENF